VLTPLRDHHGRVVGFGKVTRDLTERREAQQRAIADASRVAASDAANRAKSEFLATLSHELRTPLNAIGGYADLLALGIAGAVSPDQGQYVGRIRAAQQRLLGIINDLLNYSRIESGQVAYDMRAVVMASVMERTVPMVAPQAAEKRIELRREPCPPDLTAWADEQKLEQIVLNLLSNAVKFTPAGGRVTLECSFEERHVTVRVRDTGPGVPEEKWEAIFEPFVQLGRSLVSPQEGTGLGLAISRDLARGMGGELTVASVPGAGATFVLRLQSG
jgi:signal transduction histidine kinase